jgi:hypothetical protein
LTILLLKFLAALEKVFCQLHLYYFLSYNYTGRVNIQVRIFCTHKLFVKNMSLNAGLTFTFLVQDAALCPCEARVTKSGLLGILNISSCVLALLFH